MLKSHMRLLLIFSGLQILIAACSETKNKSHADFIPSNAAMVIIADLAKITPQLLQTDTQTQAALIPDAFPAGIKSFEDLKQSGIDCNKNIYWVALNNHKNLPCFISGYVKDVSKIDEFLAKIGGKKSRTSNNYTSFSISDTRSFYWNDERFFLIRHKTQPLDKVFEKITSLTEEKQLKNTDEHFARLINRDNDMKIWGKVSALQRHHVPLSAQLSLLPWPNMRMTAGLNFQKGALKADAKMHVEQHIPDNYQKIFQEGMSQELCTRIPENIPLKAAVSLNLNSIKKLAESYHLMPKIEKQMIMTGITSDELIKMLSGELFLSAELPAEEVALNNLKSPYLFGLGMNDTGIYEKMMNKAVNSGIAQKKDNQYKFGKYLIKEKDNMLFVSNNDSLFNVFARDNYQKSTNKTRDLFHNHSIALSLNLQKSSNINASGSSTAIKVKQTPVEKIELGINNIKNNTINSTIKLSLHNKEASSLQVLVKYLSEQKNQIQNIPPKQNKVPF